MRHHLDDYFLPYFTARWATPADIDVDSCQHFVHFLARRRHMDGRLVGAGDSVKAIRKSTQGKGLLHVELTADLACLLGRPNRKSCGSLVDRRHPDRSGWGLPRMLARFASGTHALRDGRSLLG